MLVILIKLGWYDLSFTCVKNVMYACVYLTVIVLCIPHAPCSIVFLILTYSAHVGHQKKKKGKGVFNARPEIRMTSSCCSNDIYNDSAALTCSAESSSPQWKTFTKRF